MATFGNKLFSFAAAAMVFAGAASAQTPPASCTVTTPQGASIMRAEGTTELAAEVNVACTAGPGGTGLFSVSLGPTAVAVTSKVISTSGSNNTTDAIAVVTAGTPAGTVVQGIVNTGNPSVITFSVPLGVTATTFQIANLRVNASAIAGVNFQPVTAQVIAISTVVQTNTTNLTVGFIQKGLTTPTVNGAFLSSSTTGISSAVICSSRSAATPSYWIHFGEVFPQAFKIQGAPVAALQSEFTNNTESGAGVTATPAIGTVTSGTRLAFTLTNLPASVTVFFPLSLADDTVGAANANPTGAALGAAVGILTQVASPTGAFAAPAASTSSRAPDAGAGGYASYTPASGTVTVYYEVTKASQSAAESYSLPVAFYFAANGVVATNANSTILASFAPTGSTNVPNFAATTNTALAATRFNTCTTSLLFPFVTNLSGFDTGFSISNTSADIYGTAGATNQAGTCSLNFFSGVTGNPNPFTTVNVAAGATVTGLVSTVAPGFQGYMIAQCAFQFAHGFAFITDGFGGPGRGLSQGYLALVIPDTNQTSRAAGTAETLGN